MILTASRDREFKEPFRFKDHKGQALVPPAGQYDVTVERGGFVKEFSNLQRLNEGIVWKITADEMQALPHSTLYFVLKFNGTVLTRGVLRVQ